MHLPILRRCGLALIVAGVIDIGYMVWCIANQISYSSSVNVFAVVGGILLYQGGLKTARWIASLSTLMLAACGVGLLVMPFMYPWGYWLALVRHSEGVVGGLVLAAGFFGLLVWVRQQVLHPEVLKAEAAAGLPPPRTKLYLAMGLVFPVLLTGLVGTMMRGDTAQEAVRRAEQQFGARYRYVVTSLQMSTNLQGKSVRATMAAYSDTELKKVSVEWRE